MVSLSRVVGIRFSLERYDRHTPRSALIVIDHEGFFLVDWSNGLCKKSLNMNELMVIVVAS